MAARLILGLIGILLLAPGVLLVLGGLAMATELVPGFERSLDTKQSTWIVAGLLYAMVGFALVLASWLLLRQASRSRGGIAAVAWLLLALGLMPFPAFFGTSAIVFNVVLIGTALTISIIANRRKTA